MAWIYFQGSGACRLRSGRGREQSPTVSKTDTAKVSCCLECGATTLMPLRSGMMSEPSTLPCCRQSILSPEGSPASTEALQELVAAWRASEAGFFTKWSALQKKSNRHSCSLRTPGAREVMSKKCDPPFVRLSTTRERELWRQRKSELITGETDYGFWPTPTASSYGSNRGGSAGRSGKIRRSISGLIGGPENPVFREWLMGYRADWTELEGWATPLCRCKRGQLLCGLWGCKGRNKK